MESVVVFDSKFATRMIAETVASALRPNGPVRLYSIDTLPAELGTIDLLIIGGQTESCRISAKLQQFLDRLVNQPAQGMAVATFDIIDQKPAGTSESHAIPRTFRRGALPCIAPLERFFVTDGAGHLAAREVARAAGWARQLAVSLALSRWCAA